MTLEKQNKFGGTYTLINSAGMTVSLTALGAGILSIKVPDKDGIAREVVRISDKGYGNDYHGLTIGRTSGRIAGATFEIDGKVAKLEKNNYGTDNLHGGKTGLFGKTFNADIKMCADYTDAVFTYTDADGEGGYFGKVDITVTYRVYEKENRLAIYYNGKPDCKTLLNLTNHVYFDVSGDLRESVGEQYMYLNASRVGVLNERLITTEIAEVSPEFDFRKPHKVKDYRQTEAVQCYTHGYDHPFFLDSRGMTDVQASLYSELSKIKLEVKTTYPCVVVFGDNFYGYKSTCFECQYNPDGIHMSPDDCGVCSPDNPYNEQIEYSFTVE